MSDFEELWHNDRNCIITAKKEIDAQQCFQYLRENMRTYPNKSVFFIITGHHHEKPVDNSNLAIVGKTDLRLYTSIASEWECLEEELTKKCTYDNCGKKCDNCVWQDKQFLLEPVIVQTNDFDNKDGVNKPSKASLNGLKVKFNSLRESRSPYVLVYLSCWSHYSPIKTTIRALGLYAVLTLKKERSDLTIGQVFKLDDEQEKYLELVADDQMIGGQLRTKDLIIAGKCYCIAMWSVCHQFIWEKFEY